MDKDERLLDPGDVKSLAIKIIDLLEAEESDGDIALAAVLVVKMALEEGGYHVVVENLSKGLKDGSLQ